MQLILATTTQNNAGDNRVAQVLSAVDAGIARDLSVRTLAQLAAVSESHLAHLFKKNTGSSLNAYVQKRRIEVAASLLCDPERTIKEVAATVGLANTRRFRRLFARHMGCGPGEYQKKQKMAANQT
ncbi:MAG: helix-turn-helix transcriptional regulator [Bryobacterales bacterium]|nr:helix-turn-helix transcriptional regulator [Bryobacterales bacterium]